MNIKQESQLLRPKEGAEILIAETLTDEDESSTLTCLDVADAAGLDGETEIGDEVYFICPNHDDHKPSLRIAPDKDSWICDPCKASGDDDAAGGPWHLAAFIANLAPTQRVEVRSWLKDRGLEFEESKSHIEATYDYTDEKGALLYQVVRFSPKSFAMRKPDGVGGWIWKLDGVRRVPFRLPELLGAEQDKKVFIVEGEKDVESLRQNGFIATCNVGGGRQVARFIFRVFARSCMRHPAG